MTNALNETKKVFLTVDDGPSERCGELIEFLSSKRIGAVLFCRGDNLAKRPETAVNAIKAGFIIGNHSLTHADFNLLDESEARREITATDELIQALYLKAGVARPVRWIRFPYGRRGATKNGIQTNQELLRELGYSNPLDAKRIDWLWNADCEDWHVNEENADSKLALAKERLKTLRDGGILDLHDQEANLQTRLFQKTIDAALALGLTFHSNEEIKEIEEKRLAGKK